MQKMHGLCQVLSCPVLSCPVLYITETAGVKEFHHQPQQRMKSTICIFYNVVCFQAQ